MFKKRVGERTWDWVAGGVSSFDRQKFNLQNLHTRGGNPPELIDVFDSIGNCVVRGVLNHLEKVSLTLNIQAGSLA